MPRAQIEDEKTYQELRKQGASKEKSARIATRRLAPRVMQSPQREVRARPTPTGAKTDLLRRAREIGIKGRSSMNKKQLIDALRNH